MTRQRITKAAGVIIKVAGLTVIILFFFGLWTMPGSHTYHRQASGAQEALFSFQGSPYRSRSDHRPFLYDVTAHRPVASFNIAWGFVGRRGVSSHSPETELHG
jgi:hypothetical protein